MKSVFMIACLALLIGCSKIRESAGSKSYEFRSTEVGGKSMIYRCNLVSGEISLFTVEPMEPAMARGIEGAFTISEMNVTTGELVRGFDADSYARLLPVIASEKGGYTIDKRASSKPILDAYDPEPFRALIKKTKQTTEDFVRDNADRAHLRFARKSFTTLEEFNAAVARGEVKDGENVSVAGRDGTYSPQRK